MSKDLYSLTKDEIFDRLPLIDDNDLAKIEGIYNQYLFRKYHKKEQEYECWCTSCNDHFFYDEFQRTCDAYYYDFVIAKHNDYVYCPHCHKKIQIKETGKMRSCGSLNQREKIVIVKKNSYNEVFLYALYTEKEYGYYGYLNYNFSNYLPKLYIELKKIYCLTPGAVRIFSTSQYNKRYYNKIERDIYFEEYRFKEPWQPQYYWGRSILPFFLVLDDEKLFKDTFMEYADDSLFRDRFIENRAYSCGNIQVTIIKYFCYHAMYPSVEILLKSKFHKFVVDLIDGKPRKKYINWDGKNPKEIFGISLKKYHEAEEYFNNTDDLCLYKLLLKLKPNATPKELAVLIDAYGKYECEKLLKNVEKNKLSLTHTLNYLFKQYEIDKEIMDENQVANLWNDYIGFASKLKYDFRDKKSDVIYPVDLESAHDIADAQVIVLEDEKVMEKYKQRYEKLRKTYEYTDGKYQIVIPLGIRDIIAEGQALCHCVKGYAERHIRGITTILFIRKCDAPNKRLLTLEIYDAKKVIHQVRGLKNRNTNAEEQAFIDKWHQWVLAGSKKQKKNKKTVTAA